MNFTKWIFNGFSKNDEQQPSEPLKNNENHTDNDNSQKKNHSLIDDIEEFLDEPENEKVEKEADKILAESSESSSEEEQLSIQKEIIKMLENLYSGYIECDKETVKEIVNNFKFTPALEEIRHEEAYKTGGRICADKRIVKKNRSIGKEIIKEIGKRILSGKLNLTKISFPIKAMIPKSMLESTVHGCTFI